MSLCAPGSIYANGTETLFWPLLCSSGYYKIEIHSVSQVGGIKPGCFKIGNTGGMMDNILSSKLYRPGRWVGLLLFESGY